MIPKWLSEVYAFRSNNPKPHRGARTVALKTPRCGHSAYSGAVGQRESRSPVQL